MSRLEDIKAREQAATPGPWVAGYPDGRSPETVFMQPVFESETWEDREVNWYGYGTEGTIFDEGGHTAADAAFIAHAREDVPALLAVAEAAGRLLDDQYCPATSGGTEGKWCLNHDAPMVDDLKCWTVAALADALAALEEHE